MSKKKICKLIPYFFDLLQQLVRSLKFTLILKTSRLKQNKIIKRLFLVKLFLYHFESFWLSEESNFITPICINKSICFIYLIFLYLYFQQFIQGSRTNLNFLLPATRSTVVSVLFESHAAHQKHHRHPKSDGCGMGVSLIQIQSLTLPLSTTTIPLAFFITRWKSGTHHLVWREIIHVSPAMWADVNSLISPSPKYVSSITSFP